MNWFGRANQLGNPTLVTGLAEPAVALIGPNGAGTQSSFGRCPRWALRRSAWRGGPCGGRGCGQRGLGGARELAACPARSQDVEAEFLNRPMLASCAARHAHYPYPAISRSASVDCCSRAGHLLLLSSW